MINEKLHRQPKALDTVAHRALKLKLPLSDWSVAKNLNAMFVAAVEFADVCRDFPIVFVKAGQESDGTDAIAPVAIFGLTQDDNLYVEQGIWRAQYIPAMLRCYPFGMARIDDQRFAICVDMDWEGVSETEGTPLFTPEGEASQLLQDMTKHLETLESEIQRTRLVGQRLLQLGLLRDMRFDATMADGRKHTVDGFLTVDEQKVAELPEAVVLELHRNGILALITMHLVSIGHMRHLTDWYAIRSGVVPTPTPSP